MKQKRLILDIETYSNVSLTSKGVYKYTEATDFEIMLLAYTYAYWNDNDSIDVKVRALLEAKKHVVVIDLAAGDDFPLDVQYDIRADSCIKYAHNITFERVCFSSYFGRWLNAASWRCSQIMCQYAGLPGALETAGKLLEISSKKLDIGKTWIKTFCVPRKPTKNNPATRIYWYDNQQLWEQGLNYVKYDVLAEIDIIIALIEFELPAAEQAYHAMTEAMNDHGVCIDVPFVKAAADLDNTYKQQLTEEISQKLGIANPRSKDQCKEYLAEFDCNMSSLTAELIIEKLKEDLPLAVKYLLEALTEINMSSSAKYNKILELLCEDGYCRGLMKFYGAWRTGRYSSTQIQLHNLKKNFLDMLDLARALVRLGDIESLKMLFEETVADILSQLVRTCFVAPEGKILAVSDYSAIEARILAWVANETWRQEVFATHGKIYEASASAMFNVPFEEVTNALRQQGKTSELAFGYGGAEGAIARFDKAKVISDTEKPILKRKWRKANPNIVSFWSTINDAAIDATLLDGEVFMVDKTRNIYFVKEDRWLKLYLPSGRHLSYFKPHIGPGKFGKSLKYWGLNQLSHKFEIQDGYGGQLTNHTCQAIAADIMKKGTKNIFDTGLYMPLFLVHDESVNLVPEINADYHLEEISRLMCTQDDWTEGLFLKAEGYITPYYKKD